MDRGLSFTYLTTAFPRYHFYQQRLQRLVPRWQKILDAGSLSDCKSQGKLKLKQISAAAQQVTDKITVNVFADSSVLKNRKFDLPEQSLLIGNVVVEKLKWSGFLKDARKGEVTLESFIVVISKSLDKIQKDAAHLPEPYLKNVIIYDTQNKVCRMYTEITTSSDEDSESVEHKLTLGKMMEHLLEERVILVLEKVSEYDQELLPRQEGDLENSLLDDIHVNLRHSLQDPFIVNDLAPEDKALERNPTEKDLATVSQVIGKNWEMIGIELGLSKVRIDHIKLDYPYKVNLQIFHMLISWLQNDGEKATLKVLQQVLEKWEIDMKDVLSVFEGGLTYTKKDKIFKEKLTEFIAKKTKCVACDHLSKRYGMNASLVNEFLNAGFFGYEKQVTDLMKTSNLPKWPQDKSDGGVSACKNFSYRCTMLLTKLMHSTEDYIKTKLKILHVLKKLQFEIFGLLSLAEITVQIVIPQLPKLPLELQYELLSLDEVKGCGICYGELVLHVTRNLFPAKKEEITEILKRHKFVGGYTWEVMEEEATEQALGLLLEQGQELRARREGQQGHSYGSVGCFVRITPKGHPVNASQSQAGAMVSTGYEIKEAKDHCLTCAHCLQNCEPNIEVRGGSSLGYSQFGTKKCYLYQPEALDVASVQVFDDKLSNCDSKLKRSDGVPVDNWIPLDVNPIFRDVHKEGCRTNLTRGIVMSTNYMTKKIKEYNATKYERYGTLNDRFVPSFNILIETLPGAGEIIEDVASNQMQPFEVPPFSMEGDSGSVVIADDPNNTDSVNAVALLLGAVVQGRQFYHSYASLMTRTIAEMEEHYNCTVTPTRLPPGELVPAGAVGGGAVLQGHRS